MITQKKLISYFITLLGNFKNILKLSKHIHKRHFEFQAKVQKGEIFQSTSYSNNDYAGDHLYRKSTSRVFASYVKIQSHGHPISKELLLLVM